PLLCAIAARPEFATQAVHTRFVEAHLGDLLAEAKAFEKHTKKVTTPAAASAPVQDEDEDDGLTVKAPMPAKLVQFEVAVGDVLPAGAQLGVLEAMKMEHLLHAPVAGRVLAL